MWGLLGYARKAEHRFCRDNLSAFMDGQLTARDSERVRRHLDRCQACQQELASLQRTVSLLRSLPRIKAPRSFAIPRSTPAPSLPFWMRPWAYGALRVASAAAAVLLVVALAGNVLVLPGALPVEMPRMLAAKSAGQPEIASSATAVAEAPRAAQPEIASSATTAAEAPRAAASPAEGVAVLQAPAPVPTDAVAAAEAATEIAAWPTGAPPRGGGLTTAPTLTNEEARRATEAPPGKGGGAPEPGTPAVAAESTAVQDVTQPALSAAQGVTATPAPQATVPSDSYATPAPAPAQPTGAEQGYGAREPGGPAITYGQASWPAMLWLLRQRIGGYPWRWWAIGSGALLAAFLAATLWLRARRARWP